MSSASANMQQQTLSEVMSFRKSWRLYQSRLLEHLDRYLANKRLHLVAAPGSGKTVLGLEVIRRISQPTLVLAPTITIRDQWVDRLVELFLAPGSHTPEWVSKDLRNPAFLTVATYQALHAVCSGQQDEHGASAGEENGASKNHIEVQTNGDEENHVCRARVEIPEFLTQVAFKALVLDEAHHLRAEWWRVLTSFSEHLQKPTIVALTATPPYDVSPLEWQRYEELCGPVDAEVSVPELVQEGDLCPHQDYVYFSVPNQQELKVLADFRAAVDSFATQLRANSDFGNAVALHPWLTSPEQHTEDILDDPEYLSSMVIFLHGTTREVPTAVLKVIGLTDKRIPALNLEWLEVLLSHCLYSDEGNFHHIETVLKSIRHDLLRIGAIERHKVQGSV